MIVLGGMLHDRLFGDKLDIYRPLEEEQSGTNEGEEGENDEDDEEDCSCTEGGLTEEEASVDNEEQYTVDKDGQGVP